MKAICLLNLQIQILSLLNIHIYLIEDGIYGIEMTHVTQLGLAFLRLLKSLPTLYHSHHGNRTRLEQIKVLSAFANEFWSSLICLG